METACTAETYFYYTCAHAQIKIKHLPSCPESIGCNLTGCRGLTAFTFIVNSECNWCAGKKPQPAPPYEEHIKARRRRKFEEIVREQTVECERKADVPKPARRA
jgi:hypothetical protein